MRPPPLSVPEILAWADAHHARRGVWPKTTTGPVGGGYPGDNWRRIDNALRYGLRGLTGGSSLAQLLDARRGVRNVQDLPLLTEEQILAWADAHRRRTGAWPNEDSGAVLEAPGEVWQNLDHALREGLRSLPGGNTLPRLLDERRGVRNRLNPPPLTREGILAWAEAHKKRMGKWPHAFAGPIPEAPGDTWKTIDCALAAGLRGLPGGSSVAKLLAEAGKKRNWAALPRLTKGQIRRWAREHRARTGKWPTASSGPIPGTGETWRAVQMALSQGLRGLPGGETLARLLNRGGARPRPRRSTR